MPATVLSLCALETRYLYFEYWYVCSSLWWV